MRQWMANLWIRLGFDEHDKSTWKDDYLKMSEQRDNLDRI